MSCAYEVFVCYASFHGSDVHRKPLTSSAVCCCFAKYSSMPSFIRFFRLVFGFFHCFQMYARILCRSHSSHCVMLCFFHHFPTIDSTIAFHQRTQLVLRFDQRFGMYPDEHSVFSPTVRKFQKFKVLRCIDFDDVAFLPIYLQLQFFLQIVDTAFQQVPPFAGRFSIPRLSVPPFP